MRMTRDLHRVSRIEKTLCTLHRNQRVFLNAQIPQMIEVSAIPCEVRVAIAKARHQSPPLTMEDTHSCIFFQYLDIRYFANSSKALTCHYIKPRGEQDRSSMVN